VLGCIAAVLDSAAAGEEMAAPETSIAESLSNATARLVQGLVGTLAVGSMYALDTNRSGDSGLAVTIKKETPTTVLGQGMTVPLRLPEARVDPRCWETATLSRRLEGDKQRRLSASGIASCSSVSTSVTHYIKKNIYYRAPYYYDNDTVFVEPLVEQSMDMQKVELLCGGSPLVLNDPFQVTFNIAGMAWPSQGGPYCVWYTGLPGEPWSSEGLVTIISADRNNITCNSTKNGATLSVSFVPVDTSTTTSSTATTGTATSSTTTYSTTTLTTTTTTTTSTFTTSTTTTTTTTSTTTPPPLEEGRGIGLAAVGMLVSCVFLTPCIAALFWGWNLHRKANMRREFEVFEQNRRRLEEDEDRKAEEALAEDSEVEGVVDVEEFSEEPNSRIGAIHYRHVSVSLAREEGPDAGDLEVAGVPVLPVEARDETPA